MQKKEKCCICGKELEPKQAYIYFDSANKAITKSMQDKVYCKECYERKYKC